MARQTVVERYRLLCFASAPLIPRLCQLEMSTVLSCLIIVISDLSRVYVLFNDFARTDRKCEVMFLRLRFHRDVRKVLWVAWPRLFVSATYIDGFSAQEVDRGIKIKHGYSKPQLGISNK